MTSDQLEKILLKENLTFQPEVPLNLFPEIDFTEKTNESQLFSEQTLAMYC